MLYTKIKLEELKTEKQCQESIKAINCDLKNFNRKNNKIKRFKLKKEAQNLIENIKKKENSIQIIENVFMEIS